MMRYFLSQCIQLCHIRFLLLFLMGFLSSKIYANDNYVFRHLSTSDGLSQGSVISISQDKTGFLWFGTRDGLNRYDGHNFTVFRNDAEDSTTISNNDILEIEEDRYGDLWIATYNGLNRYSYGENRFYRYFNQKNDPNSLLNNSVWAVEELSNGDIWVGTGSGINVIHEGVCSVLPAIEGGPNGLFIVDIFQDSKGGVWVGTSKGLYYASSVVDLNHIKFRKYSMEVDAALANNFSQTIAESPEGDIWVGTRGGLHKYISHLNEFEVFLTSEDPQSISHNDIRSLSFDAFGKLWVGTYSGLNKMTSPGKFVRVLHDRNDKSSLSKNTIKSTFIDNRGSLWIGVYYGGINMLDETNGNFVNYGRLPVNNSLSYDVVSAIVEGSDKTIYVATEGGGVNILNPRTGRMSYLKNDKYGKGLSSENIKGFYLDRDRYLWIGTFATGVDVYDTWENKFVNQYDRTDGLSHNSVYSILREDDDHFWIGTFGGGLNLINVKDGASKVLVNVPGNSKTITDNQVRLLMKDAAGNLWVGTQYGLNRISVENLETRNYEFERFFYDDHKKSGEDILVLTMDSRQQIWVGTYGTGLNRYDPDSNSFINYKIFNTEEGNSNVIHGVLEDRQHYLWISSNHGISKFNPMDGTLLSFDESDGLISNEFNNNACFRSSTGNMYFGSPEGLTTFFPENIKINSYAPATVITDLKIFNQSVKVGGADQILSQSIMVSNQITLDYDQAIFTLDFAIPSFINPNKNLYSYRLKGLEENWNVTNNHAATYTIQEPGKYVFQVKGANNDGVWSEQISELVIKVNPAPWRTWWAFLGYFVFISFTLYLMINMIQSRSRLRHELELEHFENERQKSVNQLKLRFFTNISHEFRTPLTLILGPLEQILQDYKGSNKVYKQLQVMEKNAVRLLKLINQLMDFRKFENKNEKLLTAQGNMVRFVEEIYLSFKQYAKIHRIELDFQKTQENIEVYYDRDKMERVFYNLISNAFKYTNEGGSIVLSVSSDKDNFYFSIKDSGIGMDAAHLDRIFERFYEIDDVSFNPKHAHQKSTGIGLAIAKGVVEMHSGSIKVKSEIGEGSEFIVILPMGKSHLQDEQIINDFKDSEDLSTYLNLDVRELEPMEDPNAELVHDEQPSEDAPLILVVEDNPSVRAFIVEIFKSEYRIEEAENGMVGFKKAMQQVPDLIISDVMMPRMDGIEFCNQIKTNIKTSHVPFVLLTARTSLIFKFEGLESGADEYINKPFSTKELRLKVKNLISTYRKISEKFGQESIINPSQIAVSSLDEKLLKKALQVVEENISNEFFNIQLFSSELGLSRTMVFTKIKAWTNLTPNDFVHSMRMKRAAQLLELKKLTVSEVSYQVGFPNPKYFSKCFQKYHSVTPSEYAEKFGMITIDE
jgi:signal transduction histidine kinase/ligand-binding sensor domain-containing protein/DNA-binding response OmpR family regulator